jgi:Phage integrase family
MLERADLLGHTEQEHYLWPACQWGRYDPTKPMLKWDTAWRALRDGAGPHGLRFHDLRHTVITELAEMGVADHVLESISGHLSRRMLEHYSHIRIDAKRQALDALDNLRRGDEGANGNGKPASDPEIATIVEVADDLTSQSRHSLLLSGSPPSGKLLIPLARRDVRVVEGARLESVCRGNSTVGSNPTLSATLASLGWRRECASGSVGLRFARPTDRIPRFSHPQLVVIKQLIGTVPPAVSYPRILAGLSV